MILISLKEDKLLVSAVKIKEGFFPCQVSAYLVLSAYLGPGKAPINFSPSRIWLSQFKHTGCTWNMSLLGTWAGVLVLLSGCNYMPEAAWGI